jgi:3-oxoacyl-[acyl-carrier-protein] synthase III
MRGDTNINEGITNGSDIVSSIASANQLRFSEIRNFMDKSSEMYYRRKEMERIYNEVLEKKKHMAAAAAEAAAAAAAPQAEAAPTSATSRL